MRMRPKWRLNLRLSFSLVAAIGLATQAQPAPLFLNRLIEQAVSNHPSVQAKRAEWGGAGSAVDAAKWQYYPSPSILTERGSNQTAKAANTSTLTSSTTLRVQQPIWSAGKLDAGVRSAEFRQLAASSAVREAKWSVALKTLDAWQSLIVSFGRDEAAKRVLTQLEDFARMMQRRVAAQVSPPVDDELVLARLVQAKADVVSSQAAMDAARQRLNQWVIDWDQFKLSPDLLSSALASANVNNGSGVTQSDSLAVNREALLQAVEQYPSLLRFEADIGTAQQELKQKQAELWPTVYARLDRQFSNYPPSATSIGSKLADTSVYLGLQMSLGAGLSLNAQIDSTAARVQSLQSERETQRREVLERFESEWRDYQSVQARLGGALQVQQSNANLLASYTRLFVAGRRSWLELLNALRELSQSDTALTDLQAQAHTAHYRLQLYAGLLNWQNND